MRHIPNLSYFIKIQASVRFAITQLKSPSMKLGLFNYS